MVTSQLGRAYPTWEHSDGLPLTPGLSGLIRDPPEWPEHCGCEQGDTVKARPPGDPKSPVDGVGGQASRTRAPGKAQALFTTRPRPTCCLQMSRYP